MGQVACCDKTSGYYFKKDSWPRVTLRKTDDILSEQNATGCASCHEIQGRFYRETLGRSEDNTNKNSEFIHNLFNNITDFKRFY